MFFHLLVNTDICGEKTKHEKGTKINYEWIQQEELLHSKRCWKNLLKNVLLGSSRRGAVVNESD